MKIQKPFYRIFLSALLCGIIILQSCKKTVILGTTDVASLNIINAIPTSVPLIPVVGKTGPVVYNFIAGVPGYGSYQSLSTIGSISYGTNVVLNVPAGNDTIYLVQKNTDTLGDAKGGLTKYMFNSMLPLSGNTAYSLFVTGKDTSAPDYVLVTDKLVYHSPSDSTTGIRFINLSTNSGNISVNIKGSANGSEVSSLAYKAVTDFKNYAATASVSSYVFEVRDATSGSIIASYTLSGVNGGSTTVANTVRFKNFTIALIGQPSGTGVNVQKCILISNS